MLIDFSVQNFTSFNSKQELNMTASTSTKEQCTLNNTKNINSFGIKDVLKSAAIFGANGSGKSNLADAMATFRNIVLGSLDSVGDQEIKSAMPFVLKNDYFDIPTEFEVTFLSEGNLYRYGIAISNDEIMEEWFYWTKTARETLLFHRERQTVQINQRSFSEAKMFTKKDGDKLLIEKTKPHIPFISVLSQFDGKKSNIAIDWFKKLVVISGLQDLAFKEFTINLFENDIKFKKWALDILKSMQIHDIKISEIERKLPKRPDVINDSDLNDALLKLESFFTRNNKHLKEKNIDVIKIDIETNKPFSLPLGMESEGTKKLIYLLGPLYDAIRKDEILVIDEFDNKFHTLLCKFIIGLYNEKNNGLSQLIITCHDTNLLSNELFRRDQIWFVEKNNKHESELYSLVEYKEHYTRKENSYSKDYLLGKYGAIPLFSSITELDDV